MRCVTTVSTEDLIAEARAAIGAAIVQHGDTVLQFSGGISSLACLYLARPWWGHIVVVWVNAGDEFPESRAQMDQVRAMVPFFHEIRGHARTSQDVGGWPVDMLPERATQGARFMRTEGLERPMMLASECCAMNAALPFRDFMFRSGLKSVIGGQRCEKVIPPPELVDRAVLEGVTFSRPIESWTRQQVLDYLDAEHVAIPAQYAYGATSLRCLHCTGALGDDGPGRLRYLRDQHPEVALVVERRLRIIDEAQQRESRSLRRILEEPQGEVSGATTHPGAA